MAATYSTIAVATDTGTEVQSKIANGAAGTLFASGGTGSVPAFTTATYPLTTTANQVLYSSATNVISGLANGVAGQYLSAISTGNPSWAGAMFVSTPVNINMGITQANSLFTTANRIFLPLFLIVNETFTSGNPAQFSVGTNGASYNNIKGATVSGGATQTYNYSLAGSSSYGIAVPASTLIRLNVTTPSDGAQNIDVSVAGIYL